MRWPVPTYFCARQPVYRSYIETSYLQLKNAEGRTACRKEYPDSCRSWISDLPYVLCPCHTCILHVPPTGNSENSKYVSILSGNFILLTGVSVIPDNFTLWEAKGKLVNIKAIPFWSINKLNGQARQPSVELLSQGT